MIKYFFLILMASLVWSCKQKKEEKAVQLLDEKEVTMALIEINRSIVKRNRDHISNFVRRTGWEMMETESGIWFGILEAGSGLKVEEKDLVEYSYRIRLIDGSYPDNINEIRLNSIAIGSGNIEIGLEKGLRLMREGDSARIIIPPYFAHGNFGNQEDIPPGAILIYDVKLSKIERNMLK